jgi:hypothetical protein
MLSRLLAQNTKMYSSQPEPYNKWITVSNKRGIPTPEAPREAKLIKKATTVSTQLLHITAIHPYRNMKADQQETTDAGNTPKPLPIHHSYSC